MTRLEIHKEYPGNLVSEVDNYLNIDGNQSIPERLVERVKKTPLSIAFKTGKKETTFFELNRASNRIARALLKIYRGEKNTVGLLFGHTPSSIIAIYAVLKAAKIYVPLDCEYPKSNLKYYIEDTQSKVIITDQKNLPLAKDLVADEGVILNIDEIDAMVSDQDLNLLIPADAIAAIYYTSGSTGKPKGIIKKHNALHHRSYSGGEGDKQIHLFSFAFSGSLTTIYGAILSGVTVLFYPVREIGISPLADWLNENHITIFNPPVSLFHQFAGILKDKDFLPHLRLVQLGGQRVNVDLLNKFRKHISNECIIKYLLASSEAGDTAAYFISADTILGNELLPVGYPLIGKELLIVGEDGNELGPNQVGEIVVKGRYVADGCWGEAEKYQKDYIEDPQGKKEKIVFTGDIGLIRQDGMLEHIGRKDEMVKVSGYRVEIPSVVAALEKLENIQEAAVSAMEIEAGNKRLVAYIVTKGKHNPRISDIRRELAQELPSYMVPSQFVFIDALPKTPSGKIDHRALPEPSQVNLAREIPYVAPSSKLEIQLVKIWENVIDIQPIGVHDDFFVIGGDSLQAMRIFVEIERVLGKKLPLSLLLKASTVAQQAELLQKEDWAANWSSLIEVQPQGIAPPLFCIPGVGGNVLNYRDLSRHLGEDQPCYALQSIGIGGMEEPLTSIEEIAKHHIDKIKSVQPEGPYYLCGSSFGGQVAYEIAQQLNTIGDQVALVVLFDTYGPGHKKKLPGMTRRRILLHRRMQKVKMHLANLGELNFKGKIEYLQLRIPSSLKRLGMRIYNRYLEIRYPLPADLKRVRKANEKATQNKPLPPRFGGRLVLFRASHQPFGHIRDPLLGWGEITQNRMEVIEVAGHHDTLLWEPKVGKVAMTLKQVLSEAQAYQDKNSG